MEEWEVHGSVNKPSGMGVGERASGRGRKTKDRQDSHVNRVAELRETHDLTQRRVMMSPW